MKPNNAYIPAKGDYFTVVRWTSHQDNSYVGDCFEAIAVDGDLVMAKRHLLNNREGRITLCGSRLIMRPLSQEFVNSVITNRK